MRSLRSLAPFACLLIGALTPAAAFAQADGSGQASELTSEDIEVLLDVCRPDEAAPGDEWLTHQWLVQCDPEDGEAAAALLEEGTCDPGSETIRILGAELEETSAWLDGDLGFDQPWIGRCGGEYVANVYRLGRTIRVGDEDVKPLGWFGARRSWECHCLMLNDTMLFGTAEGDDAAAVAAADIDMMKHTGSPTHELFHAVQHRYPNVREVAFGPRRWMFEGTAEAVQQVRNWQVLGGEGTVPAREIRSFSFPLDEPESLRDAYGTWHFWYWVGLEHPLADLSYLHFLFDEYELDLDNGLIGVDEMLVDGPAFDGLTDALVDYLAAHPGDAWYSDVRPVTVVYEDPPTVETGEVRRVAGEAFRVRTSIPDGWPAWLRIEIVSPDPEAALHLLVDEARYDEEGTSDGRNRFVREVFGGEGPDSYSVRVVNSRDEPETTTEARYEIELELVPSCSWEIVSDQGSASGHYAYFQPMGPMTQIQLGDAHQEGGQASLLLTGSPPEAGTAPVTTLAINGFDMPTMVGGGEDPTGAVPPSPDLVVGHSDDEWLRGEVTGELMLPESASIAGGQMSLDTTRVTIRFRARNRDAAGPDAVCPLPDEPGP